MVGPCLSFPTTKGKLRQQREDLPSRFHSSTKNSNHRDFFLLFLKKWKKQREINDVRFNLTCVQRLVNVGTEVIAPPGAQIDTPRSPSMVGPRLVQVYGVPGSFSLQIV